MTMVASQASLPTGFSFDHGSELNIIRVILFYVQRI